MHSILIAAFRYKKKLLHRTSYYENDDNDANDEDAVSVGSGSAVASNFPAIPFG